MPRRTTSRELSCTISILKGKPLGPSRTCVNVFDPTRYSLVPTSAKLLTKVLPTLTLVSCRRFPCFSVEGRSN
ncbi:hypothetical protein ANCCAN_30077 [Ancylostoma caninum]|uniref:Uncharacterized protein n=1 Tax=Ancylostoma caninum TaxID=29170 RepID=A0A368EWV2_ANCCA|nr:hypothetical protein ANCCAN_30077 [Ancylostoma caninum]